MVLAEFAFSDDIINVSELKRNWGYWVAQAHDHPVTILYKDDPLTLVRRKHISELSKKIYYTNVVAGVCRGAIKGKDKGSTLPWVAYLNDTDKENFFGELLDAYTEAYAKDDWEIIQNTIDDWKATSEVARNPKLSKRLMERDDPSRYVKVES